ncbi:MAG: hypothetical protein L3J16_01365 [Anaerolineales bacterium]|nr:hypothetical protein [Anaerolineales bacterium]
MLKIQLLGPPLISWNDEFITIPRRAARALLFYMAAYGKPVGRAQLAEFLWPDEETTKQRSQMRSLLGKLREALPDGDFIKTYHNTIALDFERVAVDMQQFRELLANAGGLSNMWPQNQPLPAHIYQQFAQAAELWYGAVFIHSDDMSVSRALEQWWEVTAQSLEQEYITVLKTLIRHENAVGANFRALQWLLDAFSINDLDEELHYMQLSCLLKTGQVDRARRHYAEVQALFRERLDSPLPDSIHALEAQIFQQTGAGRSHGRPVWSVRPSINLPFVGQRDALSALQQVCLNGGAALVTGEAGSGKTRLVQEFYQRLKNPPRLLLLPCYLSEEYLP